MVFNRNKGFFLTLDDAASPATLELPKKEAPAAEKTAAETPVPKTQVIASKPAATLKTSAATKPTAASKPAATQAVKATKPAASPQPTSGMTTAEAIAAELAAAEAARPVVTYTTFAPGNLVPGSGLRQRSRRPGAALKSFRGIAQDLFKS